MYVDLNGARGYQPSLVAIDLVSCSKSSASKVAASALGQGQMDLVAKRPQVPATGIRKRSRPIPKCLGRLLLPYQIVCQ